MRNYEFEVWFKGGDSGKLDRVHVIAGSLEHAEVLARADRIKAGLDDRITHSRQLD